MTRFFAVLFSLLAGLASAAPYTPASDDQILARLSPAEQALGQLSPPTSDAEAIRQARQFIDYAREREDARFLGYARATLAPRLTPSASPSALLLMADIEQRQHEFDKAKARLTTLLEQYPNDGQAWLMLANLHRVQGRFDDARHACRQGASTLPPTTVVICQSSIQAMTGQLPKAWQTLQRLADSGLASPGNEQRWLHTLLAEMAIQQGFYDQAHDYLSAALHDTPQAPYLVYLQNDLRLMQGDNDKVIDALKPWQDRENALLRLAIAAHRSHHPDAERWQQAYQDLLNAAQQSSRDIHLREQARFLLQVSAEPEAALQTAKANWTMQREISDLRILLASAKASGDQDAYQQAMQFMERHGISDAPSQPLQDASP